MALDDDDPFFLLLSSLLLLLITLLSMIEQAGSPASFVGVGTKSNTNPRSKLELSFPITRPTCQNSTPTQLTIIYIYIYGKRERGNLRGEWGLREAIFGQFKLGFFSHYSFYHNLYLLFAAVSLFLYNLSLLQRIREVMRLKTDAVFRSRERKGAIGAPKI